MKQKRTESIRVDAKIKKKVGRHIKNTKQSLGGFYDLAVQEKLEKEKQQEAISLLPKY